MTDLILVRHGQSVANLEGYFAGHLDSPLSALGRLQAEKTAEYICDHYPVDAVYSSDLCRASAVGEAVARRCGLRVFPDKGLREIYAGQWEGKTFDVLERDFPSFHIWQNDIGNAVCDGGESVAELQKRVTGAFRRIAEENPGKTVVVTSHAMAIRTVQSLCEKKSISQMKSVPWVGNASISHIRYENGEFMAVSFGFTGHLGQDSSRLPPNV